MISKVLLHINFALIIFASLFAILSTAGNHWQALKSNHDVHYGLWKTCNARKCERHDFEQFRATQILMVLSCVCYAFVFAYMLLLYFVKSLSPKFLAVILLITFVLEVAAVAHFTQKMRNDTFSFQWSYALGWVSAGLALITGVICIFIEREYDQLSS